jgi:hypothetical protein
MYDRNLIHTYCVNFNLYSGFIGTCNLIIQFCDTFVRVLCNGNGSLDVLGLISKRCIVPLDVISRIFLINLPTNFHAQLKVLVAGCVKQNC